VLLGSHRRTEWLSHVGLGKLPPVDEDVITERVDALPRKRDYSLDEVVLM